MEWITPEEALERTGMDPDTLYKLIIDKALPSVGDGEDLRLLAQAVEEAARTLAPENFAHLQDRKISASEAAERLGVHRTTVLKWVERGAIPLAEQLETGHREVYVFEADVARAEKLLEYSGKRQGRSVIPGWGTYRGPLLERLREAAGKQD